MPTNTATHTSTPTPTFTITPSPTDTPTPTPVTPDCTPLAFEQTVSASISDSTTTVQYCLTGTAGQWISVRMFTQNGNLDPHLQLVAPSGFTPVIADNGLGIGSNTFFSILLTQSGTYRLKASRAAGGQQGDFRVRLEQGREVAVGDINRDCAVGEADLSLFLDRFGTSDPDADLNLDGTVTLADQSALMNNYGFTCQPARLSLSPSSDSYSLSEEFAVAVVLNSGSHQVCGYDLDLTFDAEKLQLIEPTPINGNNINLGGILDHFSGETEVGKLRFIGSAPGLAVVTFDFAPAEPNDASIISCDPLQDVLEEVVNGEYTINSP